MEAALASAARGDLSAGVKHATLALDRESGGSETRVHLLCGRASLYLRLSLWKHALKVWRVCGAAVA